MHPRAAVESGSAVDDRARATLRQFFYQGLPFAPPQEIGEAAATRDADRHLGDVKALLVQDVIPTLRRLSVDDNQGATNDYLVRRVSDMSPSNELWAPQDAQVQHLYHIYEFLLARQSKPFEDAFPANLSNSLCQPLSEPQIAALDSLFHKHRGKILHFKDHKKYYFRRCKCFFVTFCYRCG